MSGEQPRAYPGIEQLELLHEEIGNYAKAQSDEVEGLDRKGTTILAANGVVLGLVVNNFGSFQQGSAVPATLFVLALIALALGLFVGVWQLWPRAFKVVPEPGPFVSKYYGSEWADTIARLIVARTDAVRTNKGLSSEKTLLLKAQMGVLAGSGALLVTSFLLKGVTN